MAWEITQGKGEKTAETKTSSEEADEIETLPGILVSANCGMPKQKVRHPLYLTLSYLCLSRYRKTAASCSSNMKMRAFGTAGARYGKLTALPKERKMHGRHFTF